MEGEGEMKDRSKRVGSHSPVSQSEAAASLLDLHVDCTKERQNCPPSMPFQYCQGGGPISAMC